MNNSSREKESITYYKTLPKSVLRKIFSSVTQNIKSGIMTFQFRFFIGFFAYCPLYYAFTTYKDPFVLFLHSTTTIYDFAHKIFSLGFITKINHSLRLKYLELSNDRIALRLTVRLKTSLTSSFPLLRCLHHHFSLD